MTENGTTDATTNSNYPDWGGNSSGLFFTTFKDTNGESMSGNYAFKETNGESTSGNGAKGSTCSCCLTVRQGAHTLIKYTRYLYCISLWIKASAK